MLTKLNKPLHLRGVAQLVGMAFCKAEAKDGSGTLEAGCMSNTPLATPSFDWLCFCFFVKLLDSVMQFQWHVPPPALTPTSAVQQLDTAPVCPLVAGRGPRQRGSKQLVPGI